MKPKQQAQTVCFIVEELPVLGMNGQSTYNYAFVKALLSSGYFVSILVVGPRPTYSSNKMDYRSNSNVTIEYCHFTSLGSYLLPKSIAAIARSGFKHLKSLPMVKGLVDHIRGRDDKKNIYIARKMSDTEAEWVLSRLKSTDNAIALFDTIYRFHTRFHKLNNLKLIIGHDVFFSRCQSLRALNLQPSPYIEQHEEVACLNASNGIIAITEVDEHTYRQAGVDRPMTTLYSPLPINPIAHLPVSAPRLVFMGSGGVMNVEGLKWFLEQVWPLIRTQVPSAELDVAGNVCAHFSQPITGVQLLGRIEQFSAIAKNAIFAINPVLAGSGLKIKMIDYIAHGLACVTTNKGAEGFPEDVSRPIFTADTAETFANQCIYLLQHIELQTAHSDAALAYCHHFSEPLFESKLVKFMKEIV